MKKKIVYITGSRADFGRASYTLNLLDESPLFDLTVIITGMHLANNFGNTFREIERKKWNYEKVDALLSGDSGSSMAKSLGIATIGISQTLDRVKPDMVLLLGDRGEMLAGAISARHQNIGISHIGGGFKSGSVDDKIRDAITVFSDYHFVANEGTSNRVISLGADTKKTFIVGAPDLEIIEKQDFSPTNEIVLKYDVDLKIPLILVSFHPVTDDEDKNSESMQILCEALLEFGFPCIVTYPNGDAGGREMIDILERYKNSTNFSIYQHIPYNDYLGLMNIASVLCGNSSAGIIEAPSFPLPVVNIGSRQVGRERASNIIDVCINKTEILNGLRKAIFDTNFFNMLQSCKNPYGKEKTSHLILSHLEKILINDDYSGNNI